MSGVKPPNPNHFVEGRGWEGERGGGDRVVDGVGRET